MGDYRKIYAGVMKVLLGCEESQAVCI